MPRDGKRSITVDESTYETLKSQKDAANLEWDSFLRTLADEGEIEELVVVGRVTDGAIDDIANRTARATAREIRETMQR